MVELSDSGLRPILIALHAISKTNAAEYLAIIGKSGIGKSPLLNMLTRIDQPSRLFWSRRPAPNSQ